MNGAEKKFLYLALFLFALGGVSRLGAFNKFIPLEDVFLPGDYVVPADAVSTMDTVSTVETDNYPSLQHDAYGHHKPKKEKKKAPELPIPINTAGKDDLCFIKGVGPSLAQKIIDHREQKGPFRTAKDLEKVSGIGAKKRQAIEEFVKFD
ncbi:MAG: helix-hairpin-helix domain-containing protein [Fibromonadales bacterium]|nr:helix-hairpin-helix domain-containing protein [Fibromonadales bacterium]